MILSLKLQAIPSLMKTVVSILPLPFWVSYDNECHSLSPYLSIQYTVGKDVTVSNEMIILNSIVLPHKELSYSYKNQIIL